MTESRHVPNAAACECQWLHDRPSLYPPCPHCGVKSGDKCVSALGYRTSLVHSARKSDQEVPRG